MHGGDAHATSFSAAVGSYVAAPALDGSHSAPRGSNSLTQNGTDANKRAAGLGSKEESHFGFLGGASPAWSGDNGSFSSVPFESAFGSVSTFPAQNGFASSSGSPVAAGRVTSQESDDTALSSVMAALSVVEDQSGPELAEAPGTMEEAATELRGSAQQLHSTRTSTSSTAGPGLPRMRDAESKSITGAYAARPVPAEDAAWAAGGPWLDPASEDVAGFGPQGFGSGSALPPNTPAFGGQGYFAMGQGVPGGTGGNRPMAVPPPGMPMPMYFQYAQFPMQHGYAMSPAAMFGGGAYHAHMGPGAPPGYGGGPGMAAPGNAGPVSSMSSSVSRSSSRETDGGGASVPEHPMQRGQMPLPGWGHGAHAVPGAGPIPMPQLVHPMVPAMAMPYLGPAGQRGGAAAALGPVPGGGPPRHFHDHAYVQERGPRGQQHPRPTAPAAPAGGDAALPTPVPAGRADDRGGVPSGAGHVPGAEAVGRQGSSGVSGGGAGGGRPSSARESRAARAAGKAPGSGGGGGAGTKGDGSGRSRLLEEFRAHRQRSMSLSEIRGHVREFSRDQHGSRYIQQRVEVASETEKDEAFDELENSMGELMMDVFGNYVVQKFLDHGSARHQQVLATMMRGKVVELTLQMYGCRVVQKALEVLDGPRQAALVQELRGHILHCVRDQNGNHVVQKCIEQVPLRHMEFVVRDMYSHVAELAVHPYGCRVVQRVLEHCAKNSVARPVLDEVVASALTLFEDQYGNYVVQHTLQHGFAAHRRAICSLVKGRVLKLSQHKFASNVVERCLLCCSASDRRAIVAEILRPDAGGVVPLDVMTKDPYANYVVQQAMDVTEGERRQELMRRLRGSSANLKRFTYGKHILSKLEKMGKP